MTLDLTIKKRKRLAQPARREARRSRRISALLLTAVMVALAAPQIFSPSATATIHAQRTIASADRAKGRSWTYPASWPPLKTAAVFFRTELQEKLDGDWHASWRTLYALHQQVAPEAVFVRCECTLPFSAPLEALHVIGTRRASVHLPGRAGSIPGVAVDVAIEPRWYGPRDPIAFRYTFHLVPVGGHWTWLLSTSRYLPNRDHACGLAAAPTTWSQATVDHLPT
jgi:hypothetical protein